MRNLTTPIEVSWCVLNKFEISNFFYGFKINKSEKSRTNTQFNIFFRVMNPLFGDIQGKNYYYLERVKISFRFKTHIVSFHIFLTIQTHINNHE